MLDRVIAIQKIVDKAPTRNGMWRRIIDSTKVEDIAEVGVWRGAFAAHQLQYSSGIKHYTMIDPWRQLPEWNKPANQDDTFFEDVYAEAMACTDFAKDKRSVIRCTTKEAAPQIAPESLDMVYIDGDHTLRGITIDLMLMYEKLRPGGLLGGDDFVKDVWQHGPDFDPTFVCPYAIYFAEAMNVPIVILPFMQFLILKEPTQGFEVFHLTEGYENLKLNEVMRAPT
ncbi:MAG: class I SAM-dependent methyltransferase [Rhodobacteraceae bacterium]|nr:class I SAM-dependent methyltransferase [Paracoccaceae bacterium]